MQSKEKKGLNSRSQRIFHSLGCPLIGFEYGLCYSSQQFRWNVVLRIPKSFSTNAIYTSCAELLYEPCDWHFTLSHMIAVVFLRLCVCCVQCARSAQIRIQSHFPPRNSSINWFDDQNHAKWAKNRKQKERWMYTMASVNGFVIRCILNGMPTENSIKNWFFMRFAFRMVTWMPK